MRTYLAVGGALVLALSAFGAGVADAHGTLDKSSVPANTDVDIALNVPVEELVGYNQKIVLTIPDGFQALSCSAPAGFTCIKSSASNPTRSLLTWQATAPRNQEFVTPTERFPFRLHTSSTAGKYKFVVDQYYSNGNEAHWNGGEGTPNAAPFLTVTASGTLPVANTTPTTLASEAPPTTLASSSDTTTPFVFEDTASTPTTLTPDSTPTTTETTDTTTETGLALSNTSSGGDGDGIDGAERVVLFGLVLLAVGGAAFNTWRQRQA